jgi:hypothetical protein
VRQIAGLVTGWDNQADSKLRWVQKGIIGHWSYWSLRVSHEPPPSTGARQVLFAFPDASVPEVRTDKSAVAALSML